MAWPPLQRIPVAFLELVLRPNMRVCAFNSHRVITAFLGWFEVLVPRSLFSGGALTGFTLSQLLCGKSLGIALSLFLALSCDCCLAVLLLLEDALRSSLGVGHDAL